MILEASDSTRISLMELTFRVEQFFREEAEILDERRYADWLELLTDDVSYWMPLARNVSFRRQGDEFTREGRDAAWFDEGKVTLRQRVEQLSTGIHWAEEPVSRTSHLITNVRIADSEPAPGGALLLRTNCRFLVYRNRQEHEVDTYVGKRKDTLIFQEDAFKIQRREIYLDQNVLLAKNFTTFF